MNRMAVTCMVGIWNRHYFSDGEKHCIAYPILHMHENIGNIEWFNWINTNSWSYVWIAVMGWSIGIGQDMVDPLVVSWLLYEQQLGIFVVSIQYGVVAAQSVIY